nr:aminotransferase class V-fold PLP-dependent enzyme [Sphingomicrobium sediminis]
MHVAAHSHHLWPDASYDGQVECWNDAARLADRKWERVMGEVWPEAAANVAEELGMKREQQDRIVFAANTHDFIIRLAAACPRRGGEKLRILASDGEFHSARRQFARWVEAEEIELETLPVEPFESFAERFAKRVAEDEHDLMMVSQVLFGTGKVVAPIEPIVDLARPEGPWVVIDGYHSFMALDAPFGGQLSDKAFYLGGGYKYAMAGEGMGFMVCPSGFGERPPITGWFAEFEDLSLPPGMVGYAKDAMRFMGATFDPSVLYRWNAIVRMLAEEDLTTATISAHVAALQAQLLEAIADTPLAGAELLNPLDGGPHARFLAFRHEKAAAWSEALKQEDCITDVRGNVIRVGLGLYHDAEDIEAFAKLAAAL